MPSSGLPKMAWRVLSDHAPVLSIYRDSIAILRVVFMICVVFVICKPRYIARIFISRFGANSWWRTRRPPPSLMLRSRCSPPSSRIRGSLRPMTWPLPSVRLPLWQLEALESPNLAILCDLICKYHTIPRLEQA